MSEGNHATVPLRPRLLVASIGAQYKPGVSEALDKALEYFRNGGGIATVIKILNMCIISHMGLEAMRNMAVMKAREARFDFVCLFEDDVLLEEDTLTRLVKTMVKHKLLILSPWIDQSELVPSAQKEVHRLAFPNWSAGQGLKPVDWAVRSMVMFDCHVFDLLGEEPFTDIPIYGIEEYHGLRFQRKGVQWWMDTDLAVKLLQYPSPAYLFDFCHPILPGNVSKEEMEATIERKQRDYDRAQAQVGKEKQMGKGNHNVSQEYNDN